MSEEAEWGPWIEHDGKGCPCLGQYVKGVEVGRTFLGERTFEAVAGMKGGFSWDWKWAVTPVPVSGSAVYATRIIRYRIRQPRGMAILRALAADPKRVKPKVDA